MRTNGTNPLRQEERSREMSKKAESFWQIFRLTENGKVKSTLLLYSFCLCVVFIAIYAAAFVLFLDPLNALTEGAPTLVVNLVEALVPAAVGTAVCCLSWPLFKEKRMLPTTYIWMFILAAACLIAMLVLLRGEPEARALFLQFFVLSVPAPVLFGGGLSAFLYSRYLKHRPPAAGMAESWKRQ